MTPCRYICTVVNHNSFNKCAKFVQRDKDQINDTYVSTSNVCISVYKVDLNTFYEAFFLGNIFTMNPTSLGPYMLVQLITTWSKSNLPHDEARPVLEYISATSLNRTLVPHVIKSHHGGKSKR